MNLLEKWWNQEKIKMPLLLDNMLIIMKNQ